MSQLLQNTKLKRIMKANTEQLLSKHVDTFVNISSNATGLQQCDCDCRSLHHRIAPIKLFRPYSKTAYMK